ncbi:MAG: M23 family metallopeptidase [Leptolyngbyaceae cyanobacterium CRU_2_3]|nr:M23 family metallopeptidase [Leptolyngbyaceae cyanobacterium CRU_2_3]
MDLGTGDERPPIEAARKGVVTYAEVGWNGGFGNLVEIDHGDGLQTRYAHLSSILVKQGDRVDVNTVIGYVGMTGTATGNHLHFEVLINGTDQDPKKFLEFCLKIVESHSLGDYYLFQPKFLQSIKYLYLSEDTRTIDLFLPIEGSFFVPSYADTSKG